MGFTRVSSLFFVTDYLSPVLFFPSVWFECGSLFGYFVLIVLSIFPCTIVVLRFGLIVCVWFGGSVSRFGSGLSTVLFECIP